ncbi:MAG: hypothetical protein EP330_31035 [Deltaproteobacteria bacterium]|nr:MAG: hypothetical protein EP330_31035 [Deltaproteobacteria bacterium]
MLAQNSDVAATDGFTGEVYSGAVVDLRNSTFGFTPDGLEVTGMSFVDLRGSSMPNGRLWAASGAFIYSETTNSYASVSPTAGTYNMNDGAYIR